MTVADGAVAVPARLDQGHLTTQVWLLARRSFLRVARQPAQFVFPLVFPILLLVINSAGLSRASDLPGFPGERYLDFWLANPFIFAAANLATVAGSNMAVDIEDGFLDRLSLTPLSRTALLVGHLGGIVGVALSAGLVFLAVGIVSGTAFAAGVAGLVVILVLAGLTALFFAGLGTFLALRLGTSDAVEGMFPLFFVLLFMSSSNFPRHLMTVDWFRWVATANPMSYVIEAIRSLIVGGWDGIALARGFGVVGVLAVGTVTLAAGAARHRLERS